MGQYLCFRYLYSQIVFGRDCLVAVYTMVYSYIVHLTARPQHYFTITIDIWWSVMGFRARSPTIVWVKQQRTQLQINIAKYRKIEGVCAVVTTSTKTDFYCGAFVENYAKPSTTADYRRARKLKPFGTT